MVRLRPEADTGLSDATPHDVRIGVRLLFSEFADAGQNFFSEFLDERAIQRNPQSRPVVPRFSHYSEPGIPMYVRSERSRYE